MAVLKQRKFDGERRVFQDTWTDQYFVIAQRGNPVYLVCSEKIEYSGFSGSSREEHEVSNITLTPSYVCV